MTSLSSTPRITLLSDDRIRIHALSQFELDSFYKMLSVTAVRGAPDMKKEYLPGWL